PSRPTVAASDGRIRFSLPAGEAAWLWAIRSRRGDAWQAEILPGRSTEFALASGVAEVFVAAIARDGREGPTAGQEITRP
ncbi:MAG: hypothetical protein RLZZ440_1802, partial [Planctomycetota bacterium]